MGVAIISTMSWTGATFRRWRPGSPWMPIPISISSSPSSNVGFPAAGTVHDVGATVDRLGRGFHLIGRGRGEHLAGAGRVEHPHADEPPVHRLVSRSTPRYQGDLALSG